MTGALGSDVFLHSTQSRKRGRRPLSPKHILSSACAEADSVFDSELRAHSGLLVDGEHIQLLWVKFDPEGSYPLHSHPHEQISVVLQGRMRLTVGDEVEEIGPGDMWYAPANVLHGGELLGKEPVVFVDVYAPPSASIIGFLERLRPRSGG